MNNRNRRNVMSLSAFVCFILLLQVGGLKVQIKVSKDISRLLSKDMNKEKDIVCLVTIVKSTPS